MGVLPSAGSVQQRIRDWIVAHHSAHPEPCPPLEEDTGLVGAWPQSSSRSTCPSRGSLDARLGPVSAEGWQDPPMPVFRSIRCQLSLQDMEDHIEQESSASEEGSSGSRESDSREGEMGRANGCTGNSVECEGPTLHPDGLVVPLARASQARKKGKSLPHVALLHQVAGRAAALGKVEDSDSKWHSKDLSKLKPRKMSRPPSPNLDAPLSPGLVRRQGPVANALLVERLAPSAEGSAEHKASLVPLDAREHTWLVKVATGSWMQARALLQEDPHLALRRDFISGFTVLHWLAKHGNARMLQDFVTGAREAGIVLDVNVRSGCGYTPLHLAAIHNHPLVIKILVQKLQCRIQARDSSGKKPWQYLNASVSGEIWQLLGGPRGRTIFAAHPIRASMTSSSSSSSSPARKVSRKHSLAAYLKPQHMKWKKGSKCTPLLETEEYSD